MVRNRVRKTTRARTVFRSFKNSINAASNAWMVNHPGLTMTIYDIPGIVKVAFPLAFTQANIISGFSVTGIYPLNRHIFTEVDFLPSDVTNRPNPETVTNPTILSSAAICSSPSNIATIGSSSPGVILEEIQAFPKAGPRKSSNKDKKKSSTKILTDTPVKKQIIDEALKRRQQKEMKAIRSIAQRKFNHLDPVQLNKNKKPKSKTTFLKSDTDAEIENDAARGGDDDSIEFDLPICEDRKPQINDFVVVKLPTKKKKLHFVGMVHAVKEDEIEINFLKKRNSEKGFIFPDKEDRGWYSYEEICLILPPPITVGSTYRCTRKLVFPYDLSIYEGL